MRFSASKPSVRLHYYIHDDALGGANVLSNASGKVAEMIEYYSFGGIRPHIASLLKLRQLWNVFTAIWALIAAIASMHLSWPMGTLNYITTLLLGHDVAKVKIFDEAILVSEPQAGEHLGSDL